jgi:hypothetical protein
VYILEEIAGISSMTLRMTLLLYCNHYILLDEMPNAGSG